MNVLILTYWSYKDALVQTYTLPYVRVIKNHIKDGKIFLFTIEQPHHKMNELDWKEECLKLKEENIHLIRVKYAPFGFKMGLRFFAIIPKLLLLIFSEKIEKIHSWCTPAGALGYVLSAFTRKPLIIDSYEPHAESMVENGEWKRESWKFKLLFWLEKKQSQKAETVIALTDGMREYALEKYNTSFKNYYVKPSLIDFKNFKWSEDKYHELRSERDLGNQIVLVYAGKLGGIYLKEEVFDFFKIAENFWGKQLKIFLLTAHNQNEVQEFITRKNISPSVIESKFVPHNEIINYLQLADFAINPVKPVSTKRYCTSIKDGEYWAMGLPIVITKNISDDSSIIEKNNIGYVLKELNNEEYLKACVHVNDLISKDIRRKITSIGIENRSMDIASTIYSKIYT